MSVEEIRVSAEWLSLREPADATARVAGLVERLPVRTAHVIHDLACGSGSMGRWLAPRLPGSQHWVLHDRDADLLERAAADPPRGATVETCCGDVTRLEPDDLAGATLITASALLDLLTGDELDRLVAVCAAAGCPVLFCLSVTGRVALLPHDPRDARIGAAFNAHQRRAGLLGPDAVAAAVERFRRTGAEVFVEPSPWRLDPSQRALIAEWFGGWTGAAREYEPQIDADRDPPELVTVDHADLLVLP